MTPKEVDGEIELEADPNECHTTNCDDAIEELEVQGINMMTFVKI